MSDNHLGAPDIHIQISGTNFTSVARCQARAGGVYFHCDLGNKGASAWRVLGRQPSISGESTIPTTKKIDPTFKLQVDAGGFLLMFDTPIDPAGT